jgi:hypothetical protein
VTLGVNSNNPWQMTPNTDRRNFRSEQKSVKVIENLVDFWILKKRIFVYGFGYLLFSIV